MSVSFRFDPVTLPPAAQALRQEVREFLHNEITAGTFNPRGVSRDNNYSAEFSRIAPSLTIQGGTRKVLRGSIARGLGLR